MSFPSIFYTSKCQLFFKQSCISFTLQNSIKLAWRNHGVSMESIKLRLYAYKFCIQRTRSYYKFWYEFVCNTNHIIVNIINNNIVKMRQRKLYSHAYMHSHQCTHIYKPLQIHTHTHAYTLTHTHTQQNTTRTQTLTCKA